MTVLIVVIAAVIIGGIVMVIIHEQAKRNHGRDARFAESMGLELQKNVAGDNSGFVGNYEGLRLKIWNETDEDSEYSTVLHIVEMLAGREIPTELRINIIRSGGAGRFLDKTIGRIGGKKVEFENSEFIEHAIVRCEDEGFAKQILGLDVQRRLMEVGKGEFLLKKNSVRYEDSGVAQKNEENLKIVIPVLAVLTRALDKMSPE